MRDLQHQLRDYWARIAAGLPVPTAEQALTARVGEGAVRPLVDRPGPRPRPALAAAGRALLGRRRGEMTATSTTPQAAPRWRKPALAIGVAFVVTLAAVGTTLLLTRGGEERPPITTPPATTTTEGALSVEAWSYPVEAVPPFHATIAWDRNPESTWNLGYQGSTALIEVWYEAPRRLRWQLVELDTDLVAQGVPEAGQHFGGSGSFLVGDGAAMGQYLANANRWRDWEAGDYLDFMFWEPATPGPGHDWAGQCRQNVISLTTETVAGRETNHVVCRAIRGDWDLWVDAVTGLILKMRGETGIDDFSLGSSPAGGFEVTSLEFLEAPIPESESLFAVVPPEGAEVDAPPAATWVPPLHTVIAFSVEGPQPSSHTEEIWYQDQQSWRAEVLEVAGLAEWAAGVIEGPGDLQVMSAGAYTMFWPKDASGYENAYWVAEEGYGGTGVEQLDPGDMATGWTQVGLESVAGRPATHWVRHDTYEGGSSTTDLWIDTVTGLKLRSASENIAGDAVSRSSQTVLSIEFDPDFPQGVFTFIPEPGWCNLNDMSGCVRGMWDGTNLRPGEEVSIFTGPLADGTPFDLADLRGRPVIVFLWMDAFAPGVLDQWLEDFEALYEEWGDRVAFVSVPELEQTDVRRFVDRMPLTHLVVTCYGDFIDPEHPGGQLCIPSSPSDLWHVGWPTWLMIDGNGRAAGLLGTTDTTYEDLKAMIAAAVGG